jgi:hypothetical protein
LRLLGSRCTKEILLESSPNDLAAALLLRIKIIRVTPNMLKNPARIDLAIELCGIMFNVLHYPLGPILQISLVVIPIDEG